MVKVQLFFTLYLVPYIFYTKIKVMHDRGLVKIDLIYKKVLIFSAQIQMNIDKIKELDIVERIVLVEDIWDSIAKEQDKLNQYELKVHRLLCGLKVLAYAYSNIIVPKSLFDGLRWCSRHS